MTSKWLLNIDFSSSSLLYTTAKRTLILSLTCKSQGTFKTQPTPVPHKLLLPEGQSLAPSKDNEDNCASWLQPRDELMVFAKSI